MARRTDSVNYNESDLKLFMKLTVDASTISPYSQHPNARNPDKYTSFISFNYDQIRNDGSYFIFSPVTLAALYEFKIIHEADDGYRTEVSNGLSCPLLVSPGSPQAAKTWSGNPSFLTLTAGIPTPIQVFAVDKSGNPAPLEFSDVKSVATYTKYSASSITVNLTRLPNDPHLVSINYVALLTGTVKVYVFLFESLLDAFAEYNGGVADKTVLMQVKPGLTDVSKCTLKDATVFKQPRLTSDSFPLLLILERDGSGNIVPPSLGTVFTLTLSLVSNPMVAFTFTSVVGGNIRTDLADYHVIQFQPTLAGDFDVDIGNLGTSISGFPLQDKWTVSAGYIEPTLSSVQGVIQNNIYQVNEKISAYIVGFDAFNNSMPLVSDFDLPSMEVVLVNGQSGESFPAGVKTNQAVGGFDLEIVLSKPGNYTLLASFNQRNFNNSNKIAFLVQSETADVLTKGEGTKKCKVGVTCRFVIMALDTGGNVQSYKEPDNVEVFAGSDESETAFSDIGVQSLGKGYYSVSYLSLKAGQNELLIRVNGKQLAKLSVYSDVTEGIKGAISSLTILTVMVSASAALYIYKRSQLKKLKTNWQAAKEAAYREYMLNPPSSTEQKNPTSRTSIIGTARSRYNQVQQEEWPDGMESQSELNRAVKFEVISKDVELQTIKQIAESAASSPLSPAKSERSLFFSGPPSP